MRIARFARLFGCAAHYFDGFIGNEDITRPREGCAGGAYVNGGVYVPEIESELSRATRALTNQRRNAPERMVLIKPTKVSETVG